MGLGSLGNTLIWDPALITQEAAVIWFLNSNGGCSWRPFLKEWCEWSRRETHHSAARTDANVRRNETTQPATKGEEQVQRQR